MNSFGRQIIYSDVDKVTESNVLDVLSLAYSTHQSNVAQMKDLFSYYTGKQDILFRADKTIRPDIDYRIPENHCKEIIDFKEGYAIGDPIQYNDRTGRKQEDILLLNDIMDYEGRNHVDEMTVENNMIHGTSYKMALPRKTQSGPSGIKIFSLSPLQTYVVYSSSFEHQPLCAVWFAVDSQNVRKSFVYTPDEVITVRDNIQVERVERNGVGMIPIVEYPCNNARIGAFEPITGLQDALNLVQSDRVNAVAEFVQSLMVATNCNFEEGVTAKTIMESGLVKLTSAEGVHQDIKLLTQELNQSSTQSLKNDIYNAILTICAMPNRNGGSSTSDTGIAVVYRDGWSAAETWEKKYEAVYKRSERQFLEVCCEIFKRVGGPDLEASDIEVKFTRKNYENIYQKAQVFDLLSKNQYISKRLPFVICGLFPDPEEAYKESEETIRKAETAEAESIESETT